MTLELVLLGDSVFDNARYVAEGHSVTDHLSVILQHSAKVMLLARDGSVTAQVSGSLQSVPRTATHLVLSSGGNDALSDALVLNFAVGDVRAALDRVGERTERFQNDYRSLLRSMALLKLPFAVCTIYDRVPGIGRAERTALAIYNDVIARTALSAGAGVIDLRELFTEAADYSDVSPIEPSSRGGQKLAVAISKWLKQR